MIQSFATKSLLVDTTRITLRRLNHAEFEQLYQDNPDLRLELTATGELVTMAQIVSKEHTESRLQLAECGFKYLT